MIQQNRLPSVSIGMPVYNGAKYIREALDSLLAQTFIDFELIISDNCSTDNTPKICQEYAVSDCRIRYIRQNNNIGASANFEFVLHVAQAKYFMWAASDDLWSNNWIEFLYYKTSQTSNVATFGKVVPIDQFSAPINHIALKKNYNFGGSKLVRRLNFFIFPESMGKANVIHGLYETIALKKLSLPSYNYDYIFIFDLLNFLEINVVSNCYLYKRIHLESTGNEIKKNNILNKLLTILIPLPLKLLKEYLTHCDFKEKIAMFFFMPIKYLFIYFSFIKILINKLFP